MDVMFLEAPYSGEVKLIEDTINYLKENNYQKVGLYASVQFVNQLEKIKEQLQEIFDSNAYYGDRHNLVIQPYLHTAEKIRALVKGLSDDILSDLKSGAVDIIVLKRAIFEILDNLIKSIAYEKTKLERKLGREREKHDVDEGEFVNFLISRLGSTREELESEFSSDEDE